MQLTLEQIPKELETEINESFENVKITLSNKIDDSTRSFRTRFKKILNFEPQTTKTMINPTTFKEEQIQGDFELVEDYLIRYSSDLNEVVQILKMEYTRKV